MLLLRSGSLIHSPASGEDGRFLESMFVVSFEAVKRATSVRPRIVETLSQLADTVEHALRTGTQDASVRADLDIEPAVTEILAAGWGLAYGWIVLPERFDLPLELQRMRERITDRVGA